MPIRAIETRYNGLLFRSRLEARWAVFFDVLCVPYQYESQGFTIRSAAGRDWSYLPDFFLTDSATWVEVKGDLASTTEDYLEMIAGIFANGGALPGVSGSLDSARGLLWLGPVPSEWAADRVWPWHPVVQAGPGGGRVNVARFTGSGELEVARRGDWPFDFRSRGCAEAIRPALQQVAYETAVDPRSPCPERVREAYLAARSARFEHGQCGRTL
jgi:hypothetical protein